MTKPTATSNNYLISCPASSNGNRRPEIVSWLEKHLLPLLDDDDAFGSLLKRIKRTSLTSVWRLCLRVHLVTFAFLVLLSWWSQAIAAEFLFMIALLSSVVMLRLSRSWR